jgi:hypothetical protein
MTTPENRRDSEDGYSDFHAHLEQKKQAECILRMIDYLIVEGAEMKLGFFVFLLRLARAEMLKLPPPR